jgi:hypothetical protein
MKLKGWGSCSTHNSDEKYIKFSIKKPEGRDHLGDLGIDGRIILELITK